MPQKIHGHHHLHKRKRAMLEPYPHPDKWKRLLDKIIYAVVLVDIVMTVPQLIDIWIGKNASGVSVASWSAYAATSFIWLFYGLVHKDKPIILSSLLWMFLDIAIVIGALIY